MKKILLLNIVCVLFAMTAMNAQNEDYRLTVSVGAGKTISGDLFKFADNLFSEGSKYELKVTPSLQATVDYGINKFFSLGVAVSYQNFAFNINDYSYTLNDVTVTENFKSDVNRYSFALRPLFHYANNDRFDMYSGLRIQAIHKSFDANTTDPNFNFDDNALLKKGTRFGVGLVAYGVRYYLTENIGLGAEINVGAPYVANFNIAARF